jgi:hypothetical protein
MQICKNIRVINPIFHQLHIFVGEEYVSTLTI